MNNSILHISKNLLPAAENTVFLAISGGVDSVVLLDVLTKNKALVHLLHVNYHLRNEDSNADERLVRRLAERYNCPVSVLDFDMNKHLRSIGGNLQAEARKIRYDFFKSKIGPNDFIATAHHFDDQMETFFMHLTRKSGIAGMSCMAEKNNNHIRPLLNFRKQELYAYAKMYDLEFREDISNQNNKYLRNKWRNIWIPLIEKSNPNLKASIQTLISAFQKERLSLEKSSTQQLIEIKKTKRWSFNSFDKTSTEELFFICKELDFRPTEMERLVTLRSLEKSKFYTIDRLQMTIWNDGEYFLFSKEEIEKLPDLTLTEIPDLPQVYDKSCIYLDSDKIVGELTIRYWKDGDRIEPIGMQGSQLVSDIIKDAKVPLDKKKKITVVEDRNEILWVVGLKVGKNKIANSTSNTILKIDLNV